MKVQADAERANTSAARYFRSACSMNSCSRLHEPEPRDEVAQECQ